jgi:hypothetical protein
MVKEKDMTPKEEASFYQNMAKHLWNTNLKLKHRLKASIEGAALESEELVNDYRLLQKELYSVEAQREALREIIEDLYCITNAACETASYKCIVCEAKDKLDSILKEA